MRRIADLYPGEATTDARDAFVIADAARAMPHTLRDVAPADEVTTELEIIAGFDDDLAAEATRISNRLRGLLTQIHPSLERVLGPRLDHAAVLALLYCPASPSTTKLIWLWWSKVDATPTDVDRCWQAFLRRFDIEHLRAVQADPGLDRSETPRTRGRRPLDLAGDHRAHSAAIRPAPGRRSETALGEAPPTAQTHPGPGLQRVPEHPHENPVTGQCTDNVPTRPRTATQLKEPTPTSHPP